MSAITLRCGLKPQLILHLEQNISQKQPCKRTRAYEFVADQLENSITLYPYACSLQIPTDTYNVGESARITKKSGQVSPNSVIVSCLQRTSQ